MYVISFLIIDYLIKQDIKAGNVSFTVEVCENLLVFCLITLLIGGRLGYVLFYDLGFYLENPIKIFYLWEGGMSFHGGLIGTIFGFYF
ncbi:MAG: prolipoprotein diacylglyceryl transferase family protein, partial [Pseudomonadota bacterium]|nr:prolipoprotein diacylglyceryl transferase family protein [Pseudomonadota bacterium]